MSSVKAPKAMKVVILAGGFGTRLNDGSSQDPKPLVSIGEHPILWHIMKIYSHFGFSDFVICLGFKGFAIKEYFSNLALHASDVTFDFKSATPSVTMRRTNAEPWTVSLIDTGLNTQTGGRLKRIREHIGEAPFCMTYGDGVGDINIGELASFHRAHGKLCTVTAVQPLGRFGALDVGTNGKVTQFREKPKDTGSWINGGFFVMEPGIFDYIDNDETVLEWEPLRKLAEDDQLMAFQHPGFWHPMDTMRDKRNLEQLWMNGTAPWKVWDSPAAAKA